MAFPFDGVSSLISVTAQAAACGAAGHLLRVQKRTPSESEGVP